MFAFAQQHLALFTMIHNNHFDSSMIQTGNSTLLQCFAKKKNSFKADVDRSKCLHVTSSVPFCTHYIDNVNYCSLIRMTFPLG